MHRTTRLTLLATLCVISSATAGLCLGLKIAVINMARVTKAFPETKVAEEVLEKRAEEFEEEHEGMLDELEELKSAFESARQEANNRALSEEARALQRDIAEDKLNELKEQDTKIRETIKKRRQQINDQKTRMKQRIVEKISAIVREYAEDKGYTMVLDSSAIGLSGIDTVVYSADRIDITQDVLKIVEKHTEK
jgi:Skp family chaperone for outer membrane proteins